VYDKKDVLINCQMNEHLQKAISDWPYVQVDDVRTYLSVNVNNGAKEPPRATLTVDVQHAKNLQEPNPAARAHTRVKKTRGNFLSQRV